MRANEEGPSPRVPQATRRCALKAAGLTAVALGLGSACSGLKAPQKPGETVPLSPEDLVRMRELRRQAETISEDMSSIIARTLGMEESEPVSEFTVTLRPQAEIIEMSAIVVIGDGEGCFKDPPGVCCECPCP